MLLLRKRVEHGLQANDSSTSCKPSVPIQFSKLSRLRSNVLDLLNFFGKQALTCHLFCDIDMSRVERLRHEMQAEKHRITATACLLKAIALAQKELPASRTYFLPGGRLVTYDEIVAGFTVERQVKGEPVVFFGEIEQPGEKSILELSDELKVYAEAELTTVPKLKQQVLFAEMPCLFRLLVLTLALWFPFLRLKCMRATFGLSSLGALGITAACGPSVCTSVFGVGAVEQRVVVVDDKPAIKPMLTLALSYDQRAMDGGQAAFLMSKVRNYLEQEI